MPLAGLVLTSLLVSACASKTPIATAPPPPAPPVERASRPAPDLVVRGDGQLMAGNHRAALGLYDEFLLGSPGDEVAPRVRLIRTAIDRLLRAEAEIQRLQQERTAREEVLARARLELNALRAETARLRADLDRLKAVDLELERRTR